MIKGIMVVIHNKKPTDWNLTQETKSSPNLSVTSHACFSLVQLKNWHILWAELKFYTQGKPLVVKKTLSPVRLVVHVKKEICPYLCQFFFTSRVCRLCPQGVPKSISWSWFRSAPKLKGTPTRSIAWRKIPLMWPKLHLHNGLFPIKLPVCFQSSQL